MFFKDDASGIIDLDTFEIIENNFGSELWCAIDSDFTSADPSNNQPDQLGGRVMWSSPLVTWPSNAQMTCSGLIIKTLDSLTYAPAVELH